MIVTGSAEAGASGNGAPLVSVADVSKRYGDVSAVQGISFTLRRGEFLTMLGSSGSGKTTTLRLIAGFVQPDQGVIAISGRDVSRTAPHKRSIFMGDAIVLRGVVEPDASGQTLTGNRWRARIPAPTQYAPDARVAVVVRPEHLTIGDVTSEALALDAAPGTVVEVIYLGAEWRYLVKLCDGSNVQARIRRDEMPLPLDLGASVVVSWQPEHVVVLPER
jgi:ABC-type Fe3+/spermidine/putrescine transport system ATPase subunit